MKLILKITTLLIGLNIFVTTLLIVIKDEFQLVGVPTNYGMILALATNRRIGKRRECSFWIFE